MAGLTRTERAKMALLGFVLHAVERICECQNLISIPSLLPILPMTGQF